MLLVYLAHWVMAFGCFSMYLAYSEKTSLTMRVVQYVFLVLAAGTAVVPLVMSIDVAAVSSSCGAHIHLLEHTPDSFWHSGFFCGIVQAMPHK